MKGYITLKHSIIQLIIILNCIGCVTPYEPPYIDEITDILVVEGIISDDSTTITLTKSVGMGEGDYYDYRPVYVDHATVYVECDDGTQWQAEPYIPPSNSSSWSRNGRYSIKTGLLNLERKYRLKIEIEEIDSDCISLECPTKTYEYRSDYSYPIKTPEIDSVFWWKLDVGQPVVIHVATHSPENKVLYYRWSFKEDWEHHSLFEVPGHAHICWSTAKNRDILLGSAERTIFGQITEKIHEIPPSDRRLSVAYKITVNQNSISKRAHDYFLNIKKNAQNMGSIFAPTPSELRGNIVCTTDPKRPVIGYIDVSTTTKKASKYILSHDVYEEGPFFLPCGVNVIPGEPPPRNAVALPDGGYVYVWCVNCSTVDNGRPIKPYDDWPDRYSWINER